MALFRAIRARHPDLPVILLTAWTHLDAAVDLVKAGAADYLAKPWDDERLLATRAATCSSWARPTARCASACSASGARARELEQQLRPARPGVARPGHRARARAGLPGRARRRAGADHRPERHRQGAHRRDHPGQLRGARRPVRDAQLRRAAVRADRGRAVRRRGRRLHRRDARRARASSRRPTAARCSSTRSATCRWPGR